MSQEPNVIVDKNRKTPTEYLAVVRRASDGVLTVLHATRKDALRSRLQSLDADYEVEQVIRGRTLQFTEQRQFNF
jgi:hypothetical protein